MNLTPFSQVALKHDLPEHGLKAGDVATLVDFVRHPSGGKDGAILEVFNAVGDSLAVVATEMDAVEALKADEILSVRTLERAS